MNDDAGDRDWRHDGVREREALFKMGGPLISHAKDEEQSASLFKHRQIPPLL